MPNYFDIGPDGGITFINRANNKLNGEYVRIIISANDGYGNVETYETDPFNVQSECCIGSTTVIPPASADEVQVEMDDCGNVKSITGAFVVTNPVCPV